MSSQSWTNTGAGGTPTPGDNVPSMDNVDEETPGVGRSVRDDDFATQPSKPKAKCIKRRGGFIAQSIISSLFFATFVYSSVVQQNDRNGIQWLLFYAFHAMIPVMYMLHISCCFPEKIIYGVAVAMGIWSVVYIIISAVNLSKTAPGGEKVGTGDDDNRTLYDELLFELCGSTLTLVSVLYHVMMMRCCAKKNESNDDLNPMS
jgi:hypothetical protein